MHESRPDPNMSPNAIRQRRLRNLHLAGAPLDHAADVVQTLVASQAQDFAGAKWSLGLRMAKPLDADIEQDFNDGRILRTHMLRPTWHFATPDDIAWLIELTGPRVQTLNAPQCRQLGLDKTILRKSARVIERSLRGQNYLTRKEVGEALGASGVHDPEGRRLAYILMSAELDGLICSGPLRGRQFTYALLSERAPAARSLKRDDALAELARRYFESRGPASVRDLAKWSGLLASDANAGLEAVRSELEHADVDGTVLWFSSDDRGSANASANGRALLLSIYDEYVSSYRDRSAIADAEIGRRLVGKGNALSYIVVVDGGIVGTWTRTIGRDAVDVKVELFVDLDDKQRRAVENAAEDYGRYLARGGAAGVRSRFVHREPPDQA